MDVLRCGHAAEPIRSARQRVHPPARLLGILAAVAVLSAHSTLAQVRQPDDTISAGDGAGVLSDVSTNVGDDSRPVHDGAQTIGETSGGPIRSGPMSDANTRSMLSGPVSSMSQGPMSEPRPSLSGGSMTEASSGAVKHDIASPLGERISDPLRELGPLQEKMRTRREQAENAVLDAASEPVVEVDAGDYGDVAAPVEPAGGAAEDVAGDAGRGDSEDAEFEAAEVEAGDGPAGGEDVAPVEP